jgi:TonB-linked SusC/RagA family outer membrane protein
MNKLLRKNGYQPIFYQFFRKMKLSILIVTVSILSCLSAETYSQTTKLTITENNSTLLNVLRAIEGQSEFKFFYNEKVDVNKQVSVEVTQKSVTDILDKVLSNTSVKYKVLGRQIALYDKEEMEPFISEQQGNKVTGKVTDSSGASLPGVTVVIKGTTTGTITDSEGKYSLSNVPDNAILQISFVGMKMQEIAVGNKTAINITLAEETIGIEEVVAVGYGTQKKVNLTGAVSTVKYGQALENRPITDASQALSGKISGVYVSQNSGSPGSDGATIRVRGYGTLNNTNPLVLIDGIEGRLSEINPNDIGSITVLKDAASAAIYGSRAANGVVLVETKKGSGEKITLNYNGYVGMQQLGRRYNLISNSAEYMGLWNDAFTNRGSAPLFPEEVITAFKNGTDSYKYPNTNYFDEVFRNSISTQHNLSATIGSKKSSTYMSIGYLKNNGIIKNTDSERFSLTLNNETKVNDWLKVGTHVNMMRKISTQPFDGIGRVIYMMANGHPFSTPYLQDGKTFGGTQALYLSGSNAGQPIVDTRNPFPDLYNGKSEYINTFMKGNVYGTIDFMKGLSLTAQYSGQYNNNNQDRYNQLNYCYTDLKGSNKSKPLDYPSTLYLYRGISDEYYSTVFANLNFNRKFTDKHEVGAILGAQKEDLTNRPTSAQRTDPPKDNLHQVSSGTSNPTNGGNKYRWRMLSYFGRVNYAFMSKYLAEVNLRTDASSRFAKGNRWGYFPSFSTGWRLGEESFIKNLGVFDNLKLRASWGKLGNQSIGSSSNNDYFPYLTVISQSYGTSYNFNNNLAPGAAVEGLVDPLITWETTATTDIGLDLGLLGNRLSIETDYFQRKTTDIIVRMPIPSILGGLTAPYENKGEMMNKGIEVNVNWADKIPASDFTYSIGANFTYITNKVTKFEAASPDQLYLIREGYSYKTLYGYISEGVYQTDAEAKQHMHANSYTPAAGDLKYKDVNGDGKLDFKDKQEIGNTIPKFTYGINGNVTWKNFDMNFLFTGIAGVNGYFQNAWTQPLGISGGTITERWRNAWTADKPSNELPRILVNDTWNRYESSFWSCNMSWFKLKNIQLGYTIPTKLANKVALQKLYVYVSGTDLFTLVSSKYEGFDPERDTFSDGYGQYPTPRVSTIGLNVTF